MNILFVSHSGGRGGAQSILLSIMESLYKEGHKCHCLFPEGGAFFDEVRNAGIKTHAVRFRWWAGFEKDTYYKIVDCLLNFRLSINPVVKIIQDNNINLVVSNTITMAEGALAARVAGIPHIWYIHEILSKDPKLTHMLRLDFLYPNVEMMSEVIVAISTAVKDEIEQHLGRTSPKIRVVYNGIKPGLKDFSRPHNNVVVSAGGICRRKGQMTLLRAARIVCDEIPDATFYLAGKFWEKDYRMDLLEERTRLGMVGKWHFLKWIEDMNTFYRGGSVFAVAPTCEPLGLVLLEAMNNGLPVVSTNAGGPAEVVVQGETGFIVPINDHESVAERVIYLLKNKEVADQMGINGYNRVQSEFSHKAFTAQFLNIVGGIKYGNA